MLEVKERNEKKKKIKKNRSGPSSGPSSDEMLMVAEVKRAYSARSSFLPLQLQKRQRRSPAAIQARCSSLDRLSNSV